ncbi:hypothetical protein FIU52_16195 [Enterococcus faecium]|nr:hypothetical protein FIU52_16195 [Enterococcus faecium]TNX25764.1 hypothetical protein FIU43_15370 [Enterococcus faecium]TNX53715.1 hypothetical protein FIU34_16105 [Enterococcus faecium]TNX60542.1 hypothetical protein FIU32_16135 [Enterococcus faecium]
MYGFFHLHKIFYTLKNLTTFENFRHKIFTTNDYYISIPTNNPNNTFSFLTPYPASSPASRTFFYQKNGSIIYGTDESELILQPHFYFRY